MIRLLDSNHRCQMPENSARLCVSSLHWGKTTVFLCAVLSYIITWVFSPKVTTHKPEWKPTLLEEDVGFRREEGRSKEHADMRLTQGSSDWERHLQQLCRLSTNPLDSLSLVTLDSMRLLWDTVLHVFGACSPEALLLIMAVTSCWVLHFWNTSLFLV